jgi:hypothetical protein
LAAIRLKYYWKNMENDENAFVKNVYYAKSTRAVY